MNSYEPTDLIEFNRRARAAWAAKTPEEQRAALVRMGIVTEDGKIHPDYDWTAERYAAEFGGGASK